MTTKASTDLTAGVYKLSLQTPKTVSSSKSIKAKKAPAVADSWEDEEVSTSSEGEGNRNKSAPGYDSASDHEQDSLDQDGKTSRGGGGQTGTAAPPPTPMFPTYGSRRPFSPTTVNAASFDVPCVYDGDGRNNSAPAAKRPEKTDAVARRMIASALGVKVPKQTDEQKKYDQAIREKERRRRGEEKEMHRKKEEEAAKARQAVWED